MTNFRKIKKIKAEYDMMRVRTVFFLPFRIKKIYVENIGPIKKLEATLEDVNIIVGKNASGKTTLVRAIAYASGDEYLPSCGEYQKGKIIRKHAKKGKIFLYLEDRKIIKVELRKKHIPDENYRCVLMDSDISSYNKNKIINFLKKRKMQVIMTSLEEVNMKCKHIYL